MEEYNQRSWFRKNWPWILPVGCCSGCLLIIVLFIGGLGATAYSVFSKFEAATPVQEVLITVNNTPKAVEILGANIISGGFPTGNITITNTDGEVDFVLPVRGDKGIGTLTVNGIRVNEKWIYEDLYLIIKETQEQVNLLENLPPEF